MKLFHLAYHLTYLVPLLRRFKAAGLHFEIAIDPWETYDWQSLNFLWDRHEAELMEVVGIWLECANKSAGHNL